MTELCQHLEDAEEGMALAHDYMSSLEDSINQQFGPELVNEWRAEHDEWERRVVDHTEHKDMDNPFELPDEASTCFGGGIHDDAHPQVQP